MPIKHRMQSMLHNLNSASKDPNFGCWMLVIITVVVVAVLLAMLQPWRRDFPATQKASPTPTATPVMRTYRSELYHFSLTGPATMTPLEGASDCKGVIFSTEADGLRSTANPLLSVCYLEPNRTNTAVFLRDRLDRRLAQIGPSRWTDVQIGLPKAASLSRSQAPAVEVFVLGKDAVLGRDVKWYEALVQYDNRLYAIEASCPYLKWETCWPDLHVMIDSIAFQDGVISPP